MSTDIRFPIGLLFSILGAVIAIFGCITRGSDIYQHSLNININVYTGCSLIVFGVFMLCMALRSAARNTTKSE